MSNFLTLEREQHTGEAEHGCADKDQAENASSTKNFIVAECSRFVNSSSEEKDVSEVTMLKTTVEEWLSRALPQPPSDDWVLSAGLKLIYGIQDNSAEIPFTPAEFEGINHAFKLPSLPFQGWSERCGLLTQFCIDDTLGNYPRSLRYSGSLYISSIYLQTAIFRPDDHHGDTI